MIFSAFAPKKARSIDKKMPVTSTATGNGHFQRSVATTCSNNAVITIVIVTAMPYAAASAVEEPKPTTIAIVLSMRPQFT